ncbi:DUF1365 domain-containing protein [Microbulbifer agarilyticus]|uniref:DUF1365 domain-containing protein n=1 Tax=Microbulbifer agarilyticus TaxID=260552 RepID=UPI001C971A1E|nr:DUF1365 domain-containing protein [Microbulbifer agarilyticus]MBY6189519.1 DUF1365 domain-containing protein [Microbulbifer agarilyticus]MBY6210791.1 DUF1365 domain-containing protein [Microbulbifer agarilyticus]MCA0892010.1 DUF1365 domain-containing protein [Microbulbifer agarilyticus]
MRSGIYSGWIQHRRFAPREHRFRYRGFMMFAFLDELPEILAQTRLWSRSKLAPARFCREDFYGDPEVSLDEAVRARVAEELGERPQGPIAFLANWRYLGYNMNPISIYYCFDRSGEQVESLLVDVHNTPWNERHGYVLPVSGGRVQKAIFDKTLHVSPFMPCNQAYHWRSTTPGKHLTVSIRSVQEGECVFDACMALEREEISASSLIRKLIQYPLFTVKVIGAIYWEALKLLIKRVPLYSHPQT